MTATRYSETIVHVELVEECSYNEEDENDLPTVTLSPAEEVPLAFQDEDLLGLLEALDSVTSSSRDSVVEAEPLSSCCASEEYDTTTYTTSKYTTARAEYISATFHRTNEEASLGLKLRGKRISQIHPGSLAAKSPLRVGDKLVSINKRMVDQMTTSQVIDALKAPGSMTIVVQNTSKDAASDVVECMITKTGEKIGVGLKQYCGVLEIGSVSPSGSAAQTLLNAEDHILTINGIRASELTKKAAADLIAAAPDTVTITVIANNGVVLGEDVAMFQAPQEEENTEETSSNTTKKPSPLRNLRDRWQHALRDGQTQQRIFGMTTSLRNSTISVAA